MQILEETYQDNIKINTRNKIIICNFNFQIIAASVFALCMWLRFEPGLGEWITKLELSSFYIGVYVLIIASAIMMIVSFIGCISALQENTVMILIVSTQQTFIYMIWGIRCRTNTPSSAYSKVKWLQCASCSNYNRKGEFSVVP